MGCGRRRRYNSGVHLPNAVNISPPCCLVRLTTRTIDESDDWDVGGNTNDVGIGPAMHSMGIIRCIDIQLPLESLCKFSNVSNRITMNETPASIRLLVRVIFEMFESTCDAGRGDCWVNEAIFFASNELKLIISNNSFNWFPRSH